MIILVTGGAGFIGSHLCEKLIKMKKQVIAFDDLSTGSIDNISTLINANLNCMDTVIEQDRTQYSGQLKITKLIWHDFKSE